jgi:hypothetical protein
VRQRLAGGAEIYDFLKGVAGPFQHFVGSGRVEAHDDHGTGGGARFCAFNRHDARVGGGPSWRFKGAGVFDGKEPGGAQVRQGTGTFAGELRALGGGKSRGSAGEDHDDSALDIEAGEIVAIACKYQLGRERLGMPTRGVTPIWWFSLSGTDWPSSRSSKEDRAGSTRKSRRGTG